MIPRRTMKRRIQKRVEAALRQIRQCSSSPTNPTTMKKTTEFVSSPLINVSDASVNVSLDLINATSVDNCNVDLRNSNLETISHTADSELQGTIVLLSKIEQIAMFSVSHNLTHSALKDLLDILRGWLPNVGFPKDPRTLLKTPSRIQLLEIPGGVFHYFGVLNSIKDRISAGLSMYKIPLIPHFQGLENLLTLKIGIDGLSVSKSSNAQFWPILGVLDQSKDQNIFVIGLYYGNEKPKCVTSFLSPFVKEMMLLESKGFLHNNVRYNIRIRCVVADAPARSFLKCTKQHNAYYSCERCYIKGTWQGRVVLGNNIGELYSDESFRSQQFRKHHDGVSPLCNLKLDMISQIILDYMHLCCLGVMKKLLNIWVQGPIPHRLSSTCIGQITQRLETFKKFFPRHFARRPRGLNELKHWKATEFRMFMLYTGPVALKGILDDEKYRNFLKFHLGMYILVSEKGARNDSWVNCAKYLLQCFVRELENLYSKEFLIFNVHSLLHLSDDVKVHGCLDNFSAFTFESYMSRLRRLLRTNHSHLSQVVKRIQEQNNFSSNSVCPINEGKGSQNCRKGVYLCSDGKIGVLKERLSNGTIQIDLFRDFKKAKFYDYDSRLFNIGIVKEDKDSITANESYLFKKCVMLPFKSRHFCIPLCNSESL
jgi:hypothetical protein